MKAYLALLKETLRVNIRLVFYSVLSLFGVVLLTFPQPLLTRYLIDNVLISNGNFRKLFFLVALYFIISLLMVLFGSINDYCFSILNEKIVFNLEIRLFRFFQYSPLHVHTWKKGEVQARIKNDVASLGSVFIPSLVNALKEVLTLMVGLVLIFYLDFKLALISIVMYPLFLYLMVFYNKKIRASNADYFEIRSKSIGILSEAINLIPVFKRISRDSYNILSFFKSLKNTFRSGIKRMKIEIKYSFILGLIMSFVPIIVFAYGGYQVISGVMTLGTLIAFNSYLAYVYRPTSSLLNFNIGMQKAIVAWQRIQEVFSLPQETDTGHIISNVKSITLNNLSFYYEENNNVFKNINFSFSQGNTIGIIGDSGSGKSTLAHLIMGTLTPQEGVVMANNINLLDINHIRWREHIGYIEQEPILFNDTIFNNIAIGGRNISSENVYQAAQKSFIHDFIISLEKGYDTLLTEDAKNISVGQKQRIALARALVKSPNVIILDEPTASVDIESEKRICESLKNLQRDAIIIIITHGKQLLSLCDKIIRVDKKGLQYE